MFSPLILLIGELHHTWSYPTHSTCNTITKLEITSYNSYTQMCFSHEATDLLHFPPHMDCSHVLQTIIHNKWCFWLNIGLAVREDIVSLWSKREQFTRWSCVGKNGKTRASSIKRNQWSILRSRAPKEGKQHTWIYTAEFCNSRSLLFSIRNQCVWHNF